MSEITLEIVSMDSTPLPISRNCRFVGDGGSIGRDESNTLVLPDPHRRVSRLHAAVTFPSGVPTITNASTSLPIIIRDAELDCGHAAQLFFGDVLEIGPYVLRVQLAAPSEQRDHGMVLPARSDGLLVMAEEPPGQSMRSEPKQTADQPVVSGGARLQAPIFDAPPSLGEPQGARAASTPVPTAVLPAGSDGDVFANLFSGIGADPSIAAAYSGRPMDDPLAGFCTSGKSGAQGFDPGSGLSTDPLAALGAGWDAGLSANRLPTQPSARSGGAIIPEDFNPFDLPSETSRNSADPLSSLWSGAAASAAPMAGLGEPSIDSLFPDTGGPAFDGHLARRGSSSSPMPGMDSLFSSSDNSDPMAMFGHVSSSQPGRDCPMRDDLAEVGGAYQPPRAIVSEQPMPTPPQHFPVDSGAQLACASEPACAADVLMQAFLSGANLPVSVLPQGLTPEIMNVIGSLLRSATAGAVDMLAARAATKLEFQANVTIISAQANNPLKFLPNADAALQLLLGKKMPGFMRADEAMKDAFDDLRAHEIGVIAGIRAALTEVLGKFDPTLLEQRLSGGSLLDNILPSVRKTKLWGIYLERYSKIRLEAEDDFQSIFGRTFVQAYEHETARMKAQTKAMRKEQ